MVVCEQVRLEVRECWLVTFVRPSQQFRLYPDETVHVIMSKSSPNSRHFAEVIEKMK